MDKKLSQRDNKVFILAGALIVVALVAYMLTSKKSQVYVQENSPSGKNEEISSANSSSTPTTEQGGQTLQKKIPLSNSKRIRVLSPNGGEIWTRNKQYLVKWDTNLTPSEKAHVYLLKTSKVLNDPFANTNITGTEMFVQAMFPSGYPQEGTYTYKVPQSLSPGKYQVLIMGGTNCRYSFPKPARPCSYDMSDGLITIR